MKVINLISILAIVFMIIASKWKEDENTTKNLGHDLELFDENTGIHLFADTNLNDSVYNLYALVKGKGTKICINKNTSQIVFYQDIIRSFKSSGMNIIRNEDVISSIYYFYPFNSDSNRFDIRNYYDTGILMERGKLYLYRWRSGKWHFYNENGQLNEEANYLIMKDDSVGIKSVRHGTQKFYDKGKLIQTKIFNEGVEIN